MRTYDTLSDLLDVNANSQAETGKREHDDANSILAERRFGLQRSFLLGLALHPMTSQKLTAVVEQGILESRKRIITNHNLHSVYLFHRHQKLREFYKNAHWTFIDGMPLIGLGRLYGYALEREQRVTLADWIHPLMETAAQKRWRVFNLGSPEGVAEKGAAALRRLYPGLKVEVSHGYFDSKPCSAENEAVLQRINAHQPDLLMVGMSMPRQEFGRRKISNGSMRV